MQAIAVVVVVVVIHLPVCRMAKGSTKLSKEDRAAKAQARKAKAEAEAAAAKEERMARLMKEFNDAADPKKTKRNWEPITGCWSYSEMTDGERFKYAYKLSNHVAESLEVGKKVEAIYQAWKEKQPNSLLKDGYQHQRAWEKYSKDPVIAIQFGEHPIEILEENWRKYQEDMAKLDQRQREYEAQ